MKKSRFAEPLKVLIEENPAFGYRTVAHLLDFNKNAVQRIFQLKGWQGKRRPIGFRPPVKALPLIAQAPNERWATDLCRIWAGRDQLGGTIVFLSNASMSKPLAAL
jgi:putative transposase